MTTKTWYRVAAAVLTVIGAIRIETAASAYFETADEPFHIACGLWWLDGRYPETCYDHAPLARVAAALPLYSRGQRPSDYSKEAFLEGTADFRSAGGYETTLALARLGVLPFFLAASLIVWIWARRLYGYGTALASLFLFQGLPPILGHAGLVTTDMALTAILALAFLALTIWLEHASARRCVLLGASVGLSILSKHSALPFFVAGGALIIASWGIGEWRQKPWTWPRIRVRVVQGMLALATALFVAWAGYRFSLVPLSRAAWRPHTAVSRFLRADRLLAKHPALQERFNRALEAPVPAGDLILGLSKVGHRDGLHGRWSYFMGQVSDRGWKLFFPTLLLYKTPIAFLLFLAAGLFLFRRRDTSRPVWERLAPLLGVAGIMAVAVSAPINIGVRHVLPVYPMLAIEAGAGLAGLLQPGRRAILRRALAVLLAVWFVASSAMAHPDYLPYFNELAGKEPQRIAMDSDLDWNQDIKRVMARMHALGVNRLAIHCDGCWFLTLPNLPPIPGAPRDIRLLKPYEPTEGWVAISEWSVRVRGVWEGIVASRSDNAFGWLEKYPYARVGKSMRLYYVPPGSGEAQPN